MQCSNSEPLTQNRDDLQRYIDETSIQSDGLSNSHLDVSLQAASYSPFVLKIPDTAAMDPVSESPALMNYHEDDIAQFGTPLPHSNITPSQHLPPVVIQPSASNPRPKSTVRARPRKAAKLSRYGISYSNLPVGITKSMATLFARSVCKKKARLSRETMNAILEAGDKFFQQLGGDLGVLASHAGRKTIDASDVLAIMQR